MPHPPGDRHQQRSVNFDLSLSPKVVLFVAGNKPERDRKKKEETESSLNRARRISQGCWRSCGADAVWGGGGGGGDRQMRERESETGRESGSLIIHCLMMVEGCERPVG